MGARILSLTGLQPCVVGAIPLPGFEFMWVKWNQQAAIFFFMVFARLFQFPLWLGLQSASVWNQSCSAVRHGACKVSALVNMVHLTNHTFGEGRTTSRLWNHATTGLERGW